MSYFKFCDLATKGDITTLTSLKQELIRVREYIKSAIASFSQQDGFSIGGVVATVELNPSLCPLNPCPLKVGVEKP